MDTENSSAKRRNTSRGAVLDYRPIAERIRADPEGFLVDSEDWKRPDTFARRILAVRVLLLSFVDEVEASIRTAQELKSPADLRTAMLELMMAAGEPLWILDYGISIDALTSGYDVDVNNLVDRAAVLFAETRRAQRSRHRWDILEGLSREEKERLAQLDYLCIATGTTLQNFLSRIRQGWKEDEGPSANAGETDLAEMKKISSDLLEVRKEIPAIQDIETELAQVQKALSKARGSRKRTAAARKGISDELERFGDLTNELKVIDAKIGAYERQRRLLHNLLANFGKLDDQRGVEDVRTLRSFLAGKQMKQAKLDTMRKFFIDRLKAQHRNGWLQTYIDDFFPRAELRGKKKILVGNDPFQVPAANPEHPE